MNETNSKNDWNNGGERGNKSDCGKVLTNCIEVDYSSDNSQELFSDDEEETDKINDCMLQRSVNDSPFLNSFKTPVLQSDVEEHVSNSPVIPKTPISLQPFIYKTNEKWTSDLETPDAKSLAKLQSSSTGGNKCLKSVEGTSNHHQTPVLEKIQTKNDASVSPVLSKKEKPKRQIFKTDLYEKWEITPSFENILKAEESSINVEVGKKFESVVSTVQEEVPNNSHVISTDKEDSSPKCINNELIVSSKSEGQSQATSSEMKSLVEMVKEVRRYLENEEKFEISKIDISKKEILSNVIKLEEASTKFIQPTQKVSAIKEIGLVPFSQYFKDIDEDFTNETNFNDQVKDISKMKENTKKKEISKESCYQERNKISNTKSPVSRHVKIFADTIPKKLTRQASVNEEDSDLLNIEFSQWVYNYDDKNTKSNEDGAKNSESEKNSKNLAENCQSPTKMEIQRKSEESDKENKLQKKILFPEMDSFDFDQDFLDEITPEDLKKQSNLEVPKSTFVSCGFSTAGGRSIQINQDKLKKAEKMYQEIEINENYALKRRKTDFSEIASTSKENPLADLKTNFTCGFATASGKNITVSREKLLNAQKMYNEIEISASDKEMIGKENQIKYSPNKSTNSNKAFKPHFLNVNNQIKGESSIDKKCKIESGNANHSKQFKPLHVGIPRHSPVFSRNVKKNIAEIDNSKLKSNENQSKCETIVPERITINLPSTSSENKINLKSNQRLSLSTQFRSESFQPVSTKATDKSIETLILQPLVPESPPFHGFSSQKFFSNVEKLNSPFCGFNLSESTNCTALSTKFRIRFEKMESSLKQENVDISSCKISNQETKDETEHQIEQEENLDKVLNSQSLPVKIEKKTSQIAPKISMGFSTASGKKIQVDAKNVINANILLSEESLAVEKTMKIMPNKNNENSMGKPAHLNYCQELEISNSKIESKFSNRKMQWNNILKRRIDDVDDNTPLGRNDNSKKPKINYDLHGRKLFSEEAMSDDEIEIEAPRTLVSPDQPGTSLTNAKSSSLTADIIDFIISEDFFEPFFSEKYSESKNEVGRKMEIREEIPRSPVLGKAKLKKRRRLKMIHSMTNDCGNSMVEKFDSLSSDGTSSMQTLESESSIRNSEVLEKRIAAAFELDKIISRKRKEKLRPLKGSFLSNRDENRKSRISLYKLANGSVPVLRSEQELKERRINTNVLNVSASTAEFYKFRLDDFDESDRSNLVSLKVGDGATLVLDESGSAGVEEFETAFAASPGVDPNLIPRGWFRNHYRWIIWKLASMDRMKLGSSEVPRMLTPDRVMKDLKYRYDREIDRSQRPAIRKILEKDDVPSKRMVLCIATIIEGAENEKEEKDPRILLRTPRWKIEVTDGWYSIPVSFDTAMVKNIIEGKIQEGTKIVTYGAELLNCDQGCYPLEKLENVCLKIHTNSTRRARWDAKLGFQMKSGPISSGLKAVDPNGGFIGQISVIVSRIYPIMYREKTADGRSIYRNEKQEEKAVMDYDQEREKKAEALYAEAQKKFESKKHDSSEDDSAEALTHFDSFSNLSKVQREQLMYNREAKVEKLKMKINQEIKSNYPPRNVVPVQKIRIVDGEVCAILTIWSTSDAVSILKEGNCYSIFNISAYGRRDGELHLTASRQAIFRPVSISNQIYPCRQFTPLQEISVPGFEPPYSELDTVGVVSWIGSTPLGMKNFDAICISSPNEDSTSAYLLIMFWQGISSYGFSNILTIGSVIGCSNLEIRKTRSASSIPLCYCSERTVFTRNPRQAHLLNAFETLKRQITDTKSYAANCDEEISVLVQKKPVSRISGQGITNSADRSFGTGSPHFMVAKTPMDVDSPAKSSAVQKRMEKLARYGQPPELSPIVFQNSRSVRSHFRPVITTPNSTKSKNTRPDTT